MQIIPVLDLLDGEVVHARRGEREHYQPIKTRLAHGSTPLAVLTGMMCRYPFPIVYVADLNAISDRGDHHALIVELCARWPDRRFWVDAGAGNPAQLARWLCIDAVTPVIGSESVQDVAMWRRLHEQAGHRCVLSLDRRQGMALGPAPMHVTPALWPLRVIVMELDHVGAGEGPAVGHLGQYRGLAPDRAWYAAGGVRHADDLDALALAGAAGVLIATALHEDRISLPVLMRHMSQTSMRDQEE